MNISSLATLYSLTHEAAIITVAHFCFSENSEFQRFFMHMVEFFMHTIKIYEKQSIYLITRKLLYILKLIIRNNYDRRA